MNVQCVRVKRPSLCDTAISPKSTFQSLGYLSISATSSYHVLLYPSSHISLLLPQLQRLSLEDFEGAIVVVGPSDGSSKLGVLNLGGSCFCIIDLLNPLNDIQIYTGEHYVVCV